MKQLEVQIMGQSYLLGCPDGGDERLLLAVERVDGAMCKIRDGGKIKARDRIAVLAALNLAFDMTDQGAMTPPAAEAPPDSAETGPVESAHLSAEQNQLLSSLLERLDAALGDDGRLI
jgi:cell division protein ZapA